MVQTNFLLPLTLSSKMAERSCFNGSLTIYLLVSLLVAQFLKDPTKLLCKNANLRLTTQTSQRSLNFIRSQDLMTSALFKIELIIFAALNYSSDYFKKLQIFRKAIKLRPCGRSRGRNNRKEKNIHFSTFRGIVPKYCILLPLKISAEKWEPFIIKKPAAKFPRTASAEPLQTIGSLVG
jgi:hypothetical protein